MSAHKLCFNAKITKFTFQAFLYLELWEECTGYKMGAYPSNLQQVYKFFSCNLAIKLGVLF